MLKEYSEIINIGLFVLFVWYAKYTIKKEIKEEMQLKIKNERL